MASAFKARERGPLTDFANGPRKVPVVDGTGEQAETLSLNM